jgi:hypothetical protein
MSDKKYNFGAPSIMKAIQSGEKALFKFQGEPVVVDTEWGEKYSVPILLLSHPQYPKISSKGMKMNWQSGAKVLTDVIDLFKTGNKEFNKDYYELTWELTCADDGSYWLNA